MARGPVFGYDIELEKNSAVTAEINWGSDPGWMDTYASEIGLADLVRLVPKGPGSQLSEQYITLTGAQDPIIFSRVYGASVTGSGKQVRLYALGIEGQTPMWIHPDGSTEVADEPSFI